MKIPLEERLISRAYWTDEGCLIYGGGKDLDGYGQIWSEGKNRRAHIVAYELCVGPVPAGLFVCHHCDNPSCFNPKHLYVGTHSENMLDSIAKRRHRESRKTHCPQGHSYETHGKVDKRNKRYCTECSRIKARRYHAARRNTAE